MGVRRCLDFFGLSLHPLQNFELVSSETLTRLHKSTGSPEPSLITFVVLDPVVQKIDACVLRRSSPCRTRAGVRSLDLIVARRK